MSQPNPYTRRQFLHCGATFVSLATTAPWFLQRTAWGFMVPQSGPVSSVPGMPQDRVLVVVQLGGGNDGLNTVVPYGMDAYHRARPTLRLAEPGAGGNDACLQLDGHQGLGLHPGLRGFKELMDEGVASVVQGVGYPNPNRSHFASMDVWHTANTKGRGTGWLGRYFDNTCSGTPEPVGSLAIGNEAPLALTGDVQKPVTFESEELFRWMGSDLHESLEPAYRKINEREPSAADDPQLAFLLRTAMDAQVSSARIREAVAKKPLVEYPNGALARQLRIVGSMIRDGLPTRVYYVTLSGFDTHANQAGRHNNLLRQVGDALNAFHRDLKAQGNSGRVLTMAFSEFGRRVGQNASGGTDHGTAAPMYLVGDMVRPGVLGEHPSLSDLDQGDLRFTLDFRSVYAGVLEDWMKTPSKPVLGGSWRAAKIIRT